MINEILAYLTQRNDYIIWAGYAQFAHLGIKPSPDVDIYVKSEDSLKEISKDFVEKGWKVIHQPKAISALWDKLEKNGVTFDIMYSEPASIFFEDRVLLKINENEVLCISKEALFLTKMGALTSKGRVEDKRKRDLNAILQLREIIDPEKVKEIVKRLPDSYWKIGWV
ncbi:hypothetical protein CL616_03285 [archaeon]|nr:hypothetical protein [archaeon]|tara:strand:+ start:436 stop:939 length:504 start_codon:yes stop_codon:yes gene_type:complete